MSHPASTDTPLPLTTDERTMLLRLAREAIECRLARRPPPVPTTLSAGGGAQIALTPRLLAHAGAFVTLHTRSGELRGCVGLPFPSQPLYAAVLEAAPQAALDDPRFEPVAAEELSSLSLEISVLSPPVDIRDLVSATGAPGGPASAARTAPLTPRQIAAAVRPGTHGLLISQGHRRGLLLPQVATEYVWSAERFLSETCHKAGLPPDAWQHGARIKLFSAEIIAEQ